MICFQTKKNMNYGWRERQRSGSCPLQMVTLPGMLPDRPTYRVRVTWRQTLCTFTKHLYRIFENERTMCEWCAFALTDARVLSFIVFFLFLLKWLRVVSDRGRSPWLSLRVRRINTVRLPNLVTWFFFFISTNGCLPCISGSEGDPITQGSRHWSTLQHCFSALCCDRFNVQLRPVSLSKLNVPFANKKDSKLPSE